METLVLFFNIFVLIISFAAWSSYKSEKKEAKNKLTELGDSIAPKRTLENDELEAIKQKYNIDPDDRVVYELFGEVGGSSLSANGAVTEKYFTIDGYKVSIPDSANLFLFPEENQVEVLLFDQETWLISLNGIWNIKQDLEDQHTKEKNAELITTATRGKLEGEELEVLGQRKANDSELHQLNPYGKGLGSLFFVLLIAVIFSIAFSPTSPRLACIIALILIPFSYILFRRITRKHNSDINITIMQGAIKWIEDVDKKHIMVHFDNHKLEHVANYTVISSNYSYMAPVSWKDRLQLETNMRFEVASEQKRLVSFGYGISLEKEQPKVQFSRHISMLIGISLFLALVLSMMDWTLVNTSVNQVFSGKTYEVTSSAELKEKHLFPGDQITLSGQRSCLLAKPKLGIDYCQEFYYLNRSNSDTGSGQSEILSFFDNSDDNTFFPIVSVGTYMQLQIMAFYSKEQVFTRKRIIEYTADNLTQIAKLTDTVCQFSKECQPYKEQVIILWQNLISDLTIPETCKPDECWQQMLADNKQVYGYYLQNRADHWSYTDSLRLFQKDLRSIYIKQEFELIPLNSTMLISVTLLNDAEHNTGEGLEKLQRRLNSTSIEKVKLAIEKSQSVDKLTGILTRISTKDGTTYIELNTELTKSDLFHQMFLVMLLLTLICLIIMHIIRIMALKYSNPN
ncbi:MAG: IgaA/UmoB family intracellular growth attenuator [Psychromonas sp.]